MVSLQPKKENLPPSSRFRIHTICPFITDATLATCAFVAVLDERTWAKTIFRQDETH